MGMLPFSCGDLLSDTTNPCESPAFGAGQITLYMLESMW